MVVLDSGSSLPALALVLVYCASFIVQVGRTDIDPESLTPITDTFVMGAALTFNARYAQTATEQEISGATPTNQKRGAVCS